MQYSTAHKKKLCILLPVLNEAHNIDELVNRISIALEGHDYVICFIDDGSRDGTVERIRDWLAKPSARIRLIERRKKLRGSQRGSALFAAMMWALDSTQSDFIVEMDGDLSHRPEELCKGLGILESGAADVVVASKYLPGSQVTNRPIGRRMVSAVCNLAVRILISPQIRDYSNGYRFYTRDAAKSIAETKIVYASPIYLTEVMCIWISHGLRIREFPSCYIGRNEGLSKLRLIDLVKASIAIFEVANRLHIRGFKKIDYADALAMSTILSNETSLD